jgi:5-hydroxyisourate hydrolase-like protein (transthyretin family)
MFKEYSMRLGFAVVLGLSILIALPGCSQSGAGRKEVIPVKGEVSVDGKPAANVQVQLFDVKGMDPNAPTAPSALTDQDGRFAITTYDVGDGAPAGDYTATFTWKEIAIINQGAEQPDKLRDRYSNPQTSTIKVKVESSPVDMGKIELTTK